jgi:hypothetical protein
MIDWWIGASNPAVNYPILLPDYPIIRLPDTSMRSLCWLLIGLAALAFAVGTANAFRHQTFLLDPVGYWRGAVGFLLFAIALRLMSR